MISNDSNINSSINTWANFWYYEIGVNVIPANTKEKITYETWLTWQDKPIPEELHEFRNKNGEYGKGIAVVLGKIWRGRYKDKYLVAIDLDNKKAIEEFCSHDLEELKQQTLVEQHADPNKMHIYFIIEREIPNKTSDKTNAEILKKIEANEIPALEVKSNGKGIMFVADSPHKNGSNYCIIGTRKPQVFNAQNVEDIISLICDKYAIPYGFNSNNSNNSSSYQIPIEDLWKPETKILEGHNRHLQLMRIMESLLQRNRGIMSLEDIKQMTKIWNQSHCKPPLDDREFEKQWKCALKFSSKNINSNNNNNTYYDGTGNGNGFAKSREKKQQQKHQQQEEGDKENYEILVQKLREENPDLTFEEWSNTLIEKRQNLDAKVNEYFPTMQLLLDFELSIKKILNIEDITLPFMGIVFAVPSSLKTAFFKFLRKLWYSYYTDKFTARAFVSHSANIDKDKLVEIDMLPQIKDKILLTPELSALFTGKDDDVREQFGVITRLLDGEGLETNSGVHGKRGYYGKYMFAWLGAAVDIPYSVYKFLSTIGFKIYFLRLPRTEVTVDDLVDQLTSTKTFSEKMDEIENLLVDYLVWFEICPLSIGQNRLAKIEWDKERDDKETIKIIARLALLLAHLRGHVVVYESSEHPDFLPVANNNAINNNNSKSDSHNNSSSFSHRLPTIENSSRAAQQLYNLARGHALSYGRNYIIKDDVFLVIKVVLSTSMIERVLVLDLLIANKGTLTTSQITESLRISPNTAKRTMTEFKGLELVTMERTNENASNTEYKITLNSKFDWFLTDEFKKLRDEFKPTNYKNELSKEKKSATITAVRKNTPVQEDKEKQYQQEKEENLREKSSSESPISDIDIDLHRGKNGDSSTKEEGESYTIKAFKLSPKGQIHFENEETELVDDYN